MKIKNKLMKAVAIFALLLASNQLIAQTDTSLIQTVCAGSSEPYLITPPTAGSTYQWTLSGGGTLIAGATSDNITVVWGVTPGIYTITVIETLNGCEGAPVIVDVTVIPLPTATISTSQTACFGSLTIPDLFAIGANVNWYSDAALTINVFTGNSFATGQTAVGLYTYYVTESLNGCEGPSVPVTLENYSLPVVTATAGQTICNGYSPSSLNATSASAGSYSWVDAADPLGIVLGTGSNFSSPPLTNTTTYTVTFTETSSGCTDDDDVTITVNPLDDATFTLTDYCEGSANSATVTGTAGGIFTFTIPATGGETINALTGEITGGLSGTTYSVTYTTSGICPQVSAMSVTINPLDDATFTLTDYCEGSANSATVTGTAGGIFTFTIPATGGETINALTGEITGGLSGTTYSVTYTTSGICPQSNIISVTIYITPTTGPISHW